MTRTGKAFASVAMTLMVALAGCSQDDQTSAKSSDQRPVLVLAVVSRPAYVLDFPGTVEPQVSTQKAFRVAGQVIARNVSVGDRVHKGDVLAVLDKSQLQQGVNSAEASVASAKSQLNNARSVEDRASALAREGFASPAQLDSARQSLAAANAQVESAEAQLQKAEEQMGYAQLVADYDGIVTETNVEVGETVAPGAPVITIARPDLRDAVIDVPEDVQTRIAAGDAFDVATVLQPGTKIEGKVREIAPDADKYTHTVRVKLSLGNAPANFRIGTTIEAVARKTAPQTLLVPANAIFEDGGRQYVWSFDAASSSVSRTAIEASRIGSDFYAVRKGLAAGTLVVVAGVHELGDGQKVKRAQELAQ